MPNLRHGDCLEVMRGMDAESVDSIVTDPPYHLVSIVKRFGKPGSVPAQFGKDGAYKRHSTGFMGSGSTGVAAKQEGFRFIGIEKDEGYIEIAKRRIAYVELPLFDRETE